MRTGSSSVRLKAFGGGALIHRHGKPGVIGILVGEELTGRDHAE